MSPAYKNLLSMATCREALLQFLRVRYWYSYLSALQFHGTFFVRLRTPVLIEQRFFVAFIERICYGLVDRPSSLVAVSLFFEPQIFSYFCVSKKIISDLTYSSKTRNQNAMENCLNAK
jgi:hypothetical protein